MAYFATCITPSGLSMARRAPAMLDRILFAPSLLAMDWTSEFVRCQLVVGKREEEQRGSSSRFSEAVTAIQSPLLLPAVALLAASCSFSALIAGANCAITESRLNEAAFWRGGYFT
jgi:hypothetical protein